MFTSFQEGQFTIEQLAENLSKASSLTRLAGVGPEEYLAMIATITRASEEPARAMTQIRSMSQAFIGPTTAQEEAAAAFGLELSSNTIKTMGLVGALRKLGSASPAQLKKMFPNMRGLTGFATILQQMAGYEDTLNNIRNKRNTTDEAYLKISDQAAHKLSQLKQGVLAYATSLGDQLLPDVVSLTETLQGWVKWLREADVEQLRSVKTFLFWGAAISGVVMILPKLISGLGTILGLMFSWQGMAVALGASLLYAFNVKGIRDYVDEIEIGGVKIKEAMGIAGLYVLEKWEGVKYGFKNIWAVIADWGMAAFNTIAYWIDVAATKTVNFAKTAGYTFKMMHAEMSQEQEDFQTLKKKALAWRAEHGNKRLPGGGIRTVKDYPAWVQRGLGLSPVEQIASELAEHMDSVEAQTKKMDRAFEAAESARKYAHALRMAEIDEEYKSRVKNIKDAMALELEGIKHRRERREMDEEFAAWERDWAESEAKRKREAAAQLDIPPMPVGKPTAPIVVERKWKKGEGEYPGYRETREKIMRGAEAVGRKSEAARLREDRALKYKQFKEIAYMRKLQEAEVKMMKLLTKTGGAKFM